MKKLILTVLIGSLSFGATASMDKEGAATAFVTDYKLKGDQLPSGEGHEEVNPENCLNAHKFSMYWIKQGKKISYRMRVFNKACKMMYYPENKK